MSPHVSKMFLGCAVLALGLVGSGRSAAQETVCSGTITAVPVTLTAPGTYCLKQNLTTTITTGAAITIEADSVTVDLKGFEIRRAGDPSAIAQGILGVNRRRVIVRNGTLRGFLTGVVLGNADNGPFHHRIEDIQAIDRTHEGIRVSTTGGGQGGSVVRDNRVLRTGGTTFPAGYCTGIEVSGSGSQVVGNVVSGLVNCGPYQHAGIMITQCDGCLVEKNLVANGQVVPGLHGILVQGGSEDVLVVDNRVSRWDTGILFTAGSGGPYRDNLAAGCAVPFTGGTDAGNNH